MSGGRLEYSVIPVFGELRDLQEDIIIDGPFDTRLSARTLALPLTLDKPLRCNLTMNASRNRFFFDKRRVLLIQNYYIELIQNVIPNPTSSQSKHENLAAKKKMKILSHMSEDAVASCIL
jgi:hypothetical protein